jgi:hypothetical protein
MKLILDVDNRSCLINRCQHPVEKVYVLKEFINSAMTLREAVRDVNQLYDIPDNERLRELARSNAHLQD